MSRNRWTGLGAILASLVDFAWPVRCVLCEEELEVSASVCDRRGWPPRPLLHRVCMHQLVREPTRPARPHPRRVPLRWLLRDDPRFFALLHAAKYHGRSELVTPLALRLARRVDAAGMLPGDAIVVPLPDDPAKEKQGESVVGLIAETLATTLNLPHRLDLLARRPGVAQASVVGTEARRRNVAGRFRVGRLAEIPSNVSLILVEDQITTGATITEAFRMLSTRGHRLLGLALAGARAAPAEVDLDTPDRAFIDLSGV